MSGTVYRALYGFICRPWEHTDLACADHNWCLLYRQGYNADKQRIKVKFLKLVYLPSHIRFPDRLLLHDTTFSRP